MQSAVFFHPCGSRRKIIKRNTAYHMLHKYVIVVISYIFLIMHIMNALQELAIDTLCALIRTQMNTRNSLLHM
jgi:hypothetical protein